jgi:3'-phosphoadenosine 5'-phosphosulfate sulfotransferase
MKTENSVREGGGGERHEKWLLGYLCENRSQYGQVLPLGQGENDGRKMCGMQQKQGREVNQINECINKRGNCKIAKEKLK